MTPERVRRIAAMAAAAWMLFAIVGLARTASGPAPDTTAVILRALAGPLVLLVLGHAIAWIVARSRGDDGLSPSSP